MRHFFLFCASLFLTSPIFAQWQKINDVDYIWGPFKIYNISLFTESGQYQAGERPLMLSLKYAKPVDGRDFAISLARSWSNLGITLKDQDNVVDRLRKTMPNIRNQDTLSYIALSDRGYFILNDQIIPEEFNSEFNQAVVAVWLDPRVEIGRKLLENQSVHQAYKAQAVHPNEDNTNNLNVDNVENMQKIEHNSEPQTPIKQEITPQEEHQSPEDSPPFDPLHFFPKRSA